MSCAFFKIFCKIRAEVILMKKMLSIIVLVLVALFVVTGSYNSGKDFSASRTEATQVDFTDFSDPDMVPAAGPVNP